MFRIVATATKNTGNEIAIVVEKIKSELKNISALGKTQLVLNQENITVKKI